MTEAPPSGYFDVNATAPVWREAMQRYVDESTEAWANGSSLYRTAGDVRRKIEDGRDFVADVLALEASRVVFTSGATEGNNAVFMHEARRSGGGRAVISAIEHPCVRESARRWFGPENVTGIRVNREGLVSPDAVREALATEHVGLVSVMAANNETGVMQPWREIAEICRSAGARFHCDAAQWVGKCDDSDFGACDYVTVSGHKMGAVKGCGALIVPEGGNFQGAVGGPQEGGRRAGTENWPAVASMLAALECCGERGASERDEFEALLVEKVPGAQILGGGKRLWNTSMVVVPRHKNLKWLTRLDALGFQVSTGSACSAGKGNPSHVMEAMGLGFDAMGRVIRVSAGWWTTREDWVRLASAFGSVWEMLENGEKATGGLDLANL